MDKDTEKIYTTGDVLRIFGIPQYQLYYWLETKKLPPARRTESGKRYWLEEDLSVLRKCISELVGDVSESCNSSKIEEEEQGYADSN